MTADFKPGRGVETRAVVSLRRSAATDLAFVTGLERRPDHREQIGQWSDAEHVAATDRARGLEHWIVERDGGPAGYLIAYDGRPHYAGVYVKRILVADKDRGTGTAALRAFLADALARPGVDFAWLLVRRENARGQAVYRKLGFIPFEATPAEIEAMRHGPDSPVSTAMAMRLDR